MASNQPTNNGRKRIAIIGGGISGMACSWKLREQDYLVDIYEADGRLGGHANSVTFSGNNGRQVDIDTAFICLNEEKYPLFGDFLRRLNVETVDTDMSFGVSADDGAFEWGSKSIFSFLGSFSNIFKPFFWRLLFDFVRFCYFASDTLDGDTSREHLDDGKRLVHNDVEELERQFQTRRLEPIGAYLQRRGYSEDFLRLVLMPMVAAVWCTDPDEFARRFPAKPLIHCLLEHRLLDTAWSSLRWKAFHNGSKTYVNAFQQSLPSSHRIFLNTPIHKVVRSGTKVSVQLEHKSTIHEYDHVVLAVNANQALDMLGAEATDLERKILGCFKTSRNSCYLQSDTSLLPKRPSAQVAWNCTLPTHPETNHNLPTEKPRTSPISLTFDMNKIQRIPSPGQPESPGRVLVTMNPVRPPQSPQSVQIYHHPLIDSNTVVACGHMHKINGVSGVSFAGAWMGWGFHEDGFAAGTQAAEIIVRGGCENVEVWKPFERIGEKPRRRRFGVLDRVVRWVIRLVSGALSGRTH